MDVSNAIDGIASRAAISIKVNEGDYIGEDGLLYCGKCHTPKQTEVSACGSVSRVMCLCKCDVAKREAEEAAKKQAEFERHVRAMRSTGFPEKRMQAWTFANDDMQNSAITKAMLAYAEHFPELRKDGKGLLLYGPPGTGKTYAACEAANALVEKGYPVLVTNFARLTNTLQGLFDGRQAYIDSLSKFALLVIDDLGAERKSEFMQEQVYNIIDSRYRAGLPMIVTTNLGINEIKQPSGIGNKRIYDRILERCFPVEVNGGDRRRSMIRREYDNMKNLLGLSCNGSSGNSRTAASYGRGLNCSTQRSNRIEKQGHDEIC